MKVNILSLPLYYLRQTEVLDLSDFSIVVVQQYHSKYHPIATALGSMQAAPLLRVHLFVRQEDVMR